MNPFTAQLTEALEFLEYEKRRKKSYSSINQHRSALSLILPEDFGNNPIVKRFMRGIFRHNPPAARYKVTWDPKVVLNYLETLGNNQDLGLLGLTKKLATLLALASGQRLQTLHSIRVEEITFGRESVRIYISDLIKTSNPKTCQPCIDLQYFTNNIKICVATTLADYVERTSHLREEDSTYLFISTTAPHRRASRDSIGRWIKGTLKEAGIDTHRFSAHSTRHASTSAAARKCLSWETIRNAAGWSSTSQMFARFYNLPLSENASEFTQAVFFD